MQCSPEPPCTKICFMCCLIVNVACADPRIFVRGVGGPGQSDKKSSDVFFFFFFFFVSPQLILQKSNGQFQRNQSFLRFQRGSNIFQGGGVQLFPGGGGGSNCLFPIETHITCDFPGGSGPPVPPLWIRTCVAA